MSLICALAEEPQMSELVRLDDKPIPEDRQECRAFLVVRDEALRLPHALDYHRALGVVRFFIIDNVSTDGSADFARSQPDCHVYSASGSYAASSFGIDWINQLIAWHGDGHWCLSIDADECLVYPDCESISLPRLCEYLNASEVDGLFCVMVDMYSDRPIAETVYRAGTPFLDTCSYFDKDYYFRRRTGIRPFPTHEFIGGPRLRCFYGDFIEAGVVGWNMPKLVRSVRSKIGVSSETWGAMPPLLIKIPLIRGGAGHWVSSHKTTKLALADVTGALLHFKFFSDFHDRVLTAMAERQHFDAASEYARYEAALRHNPNLSFHYDGSIHYTNSHDLIQAGFMNTRESFADQMVG
jgi:hypothetical protein